MPSRTLPEWAIKKRSAAAALCGDVSATPSAAFWGRAEEESSRSTQCTLIRAGLFESTDCKLPKGKPARNCLLVTQCHGPQRNAFCSLRFNRAQLDGTCGSRSLTRATLICTPYSKALCVQFWINS